MLVMCVVIEWITMCVVPARESISVVIFFPGEGCVCVCIWGCVPLASLKASRNDPVFFCGELRFVRFFPPPLSRFCLCLHKYACLIETKIDCFPRV